MIKEELRTFELRKGVRIVKRLECTWTDIRRTGNEVAEEVGAVDLNCHNDPMRRWERMGTFYGHMLYVNVWGQRCIIKPDFSGLDFENKKKGGES